MPASNKAISVDAGKEAGQVLVVDERCGMLIKFTLFQERNELKDIAFGQVVREGRRNQLKKQFGDAVQHRAERRREEADDRSTRAEVLFPFGQDISVGQGLAFSQ